MTCLRPNLRRRVPGRSAAGLGVALALGAPVAVSAQLVVVPPTAQVSELFDDERPRIPSGDGDGRACVFAQMNADAKLDLVRATTTGLEVLLQDDAGVFCRHHSISLGMPIGANVVSLCAGNLRPGSNVDDIVVGVTGGDSLLFRNDGSGRLVELTPSPFPRSPAFQGATVQVLVADLDALVGDDVVVLHDGAQPQVFLQQPSGSFVDRSTAYFPLAFLPQSPRGVLADFAGTGFPDLVLLRTDVRTNPLLLVNPNGAGFAARPAAFTAVSPGAASSICAGDLSGDGAPDLVLGAGSTLSSVRLLVNNGAGVFVESPSIQFQAGGVRDVAVGEFNGDSARDLALLRTSGVVSVAFANQGAFRVLIDVLPTGGPRLALHVADLEPDGDDDLHAVGGAVEDALLLGNGAGRFVSTEEVTLPAGGVAGNLNMAILDVTGEGDPDLIGYTNRGMPVGFFNDGAARFRTASGMLPSLAPGLVADLAPASIQRPGGHDLAVLGTRPGGVRRVVNTLVQRGGQLLDETPARWPAGGVSSLTLMAVGDVAGAAGLDDVVALDENDMLRLYVNQGGTFIAAPSAFGGASVPDATVILLGPIDGDNLTDVVVLRQVGAPEVFLAVTPGQFGRGPGTAAGSFPAVDGALVEMTGDGTADLLLVSPGPAATVSLLAGSGNGTFSVLVGREPSPLPPTVSSVLALGGTGRQMPAALVFGTNGDADVVFARQGTTFARRGELRGRGSRRTSRFAAGDVDVDGDVDLVQIRAQTLPRVLFNQSLQLTSLGVAQLGRDYRLRLRSADAGFGAIFLSPGTLRLPFPPFGVLRLSPVGFVQAFAVPVATGPGSGDVRLPTSIAWPSVEVPMQAAFVDTLSTEVRLTNLEFMTFVAH